MTPERWTRLTELFESALEHDAAERAAFLTSACAEDPLLRREVESMLDSHERAGTFGDTPAFHFAEGKGEGTLDVGSHLGRYEIIGFLAAGGMGEVYRARDPQLGREVGIKILPQRREISSDQLKRFEREARAVGALNHPNILTVYDIGVEAGVPYVVSELLEGETLRSRLNAGPLSATHAIDLALQIASGLDAAHGKGIVHRDIKPENVFVTRDGLVKILDFGLAKQTGAFAASHTAGGTSFTGDGLVMGTAGYMSPEQVRGQQADARSDVFAFGAVLYEMLTGLRAFTGDSAVETMNAILAMQPPALSVTTPDLPAALDRVVQRCVEKDPARRFPSTRELGAALEATPQSMQTVPRRGYGLRASVTEVSTPPATRHRVVLAVLPFENMSDDEDQEYFSDGLTDEMIAQLGRLNPQRLGVIARTSAMKYKHTHKSIDVIGRELAVSYILEGSVRRSATRVRVTAQLIQVSDQTHLWAQSYDREVGDMLALQSDVAHAIAGEIRVQLTPEERVRLAKVQPVDPAAYEAYLKGRYFWNRRTRESLEKAVRCFQKAIDIDPGYVAAYAGLADVYLTQLDYNYLPPRDAFALANRAVLDALRLDDTLAEAHTSLGHLRLHEFNWRSAQQEFERAIALNPGYGTAHYYYGNLLAALGRFDKAVVEADRALEVDPMSPNTRQNRLFILYLARRYEQAIEEVQEIIDIDPTYTAIYYYLGLIYERQGKYTQAIDAFQKVSPTSQSRGSTVLAAIGHTYAMAGNRIEVTQVLEQLEVVSTREYVSSYDLALLYLALGNPDRACSLLSKAYDDHSSFLPFLNVDARLDGVRSDPRFQALVQRMNFPGGQEASGRLTRVPRAARIAAILLFVTGMTAAGLFINSRQPSPSIGASGRPALAVMPFDDYSGDPSVGWLSDGLASMLVTSLAQTPGLDVIGNERLDATFTELGRDASDRNARSDAARHAGAGTLLAGSLFKVGDNIRIDVQLQDVETGRVVAATSETGQDVFTLVDALTARIRTALEVGDHPPGRRIAEVTTHSMEAFRLYTEGYAAIRGLRTNEARQALEAALRLDPTYALAHVGLSEAFGKFGDQKKAEEHLRNAVALAHRLSDRDRLLVEAREAHFAGETDRTVRALEAFLARWPDEDTAWDLLVHAYGRDPALRVRELDVLQRWRKAVPGPGAGHMHNHFGYAYLDAGRLADAIASFQDYTRVSPREPNSYDSLGEGLMIGSRLEEAIRSYDTALSVDPLFGPSLAGRSWALARRGQFEDALTGIAALEDLGERGGVGWRHVHFIRAFLASRAGRYRDAASAIERGLRLAEDLQSRALEIELRLAAALSALETRQASRARTYAQNALAMLDRDPAVEPLFDPSVLRTFARFVIGLAEIRAGRLAAAEHQLEEQRADSRSDNRLQTWWHHALAGEIAFARGDLAGAEQLWRTGLPQRKMDFSMRYATTMFANQLPHRDWKARLQRARGDFAGAAATYDALNTPWAESPWTAIVEPRFVLERARVLNRAGDVSTARAEYVRFLELWKDADAGLPELAEARTYLTRFVRH